MALVIGHLVPAVRTLISVPAGVSRMPLLPFLAASALGTVAWTAFLTAAGYLLNRSTSGSKATPTSGPTSSSA